MTSEFKTILGITDTGANWIELESTVALCQSMGAHLSLLVLDAATPAPVSQYGRALAIQAGVQYEHGTEAVNAKLKELKEELDAHAVDSDLTCAYLLPSEIDLLVAEHARYADISVFISRPHESPTLYRHALHGALIQSGKPVLIMPETHSTFEFKRPLIAWDGGLYAARSVHNAITVLAAADEVNAVVIDGSTSTAGVAGNLREYLGRHNISVQVQEHQLQGRRVSDLLLEAVQTLSADSIIMGGYGHSRLREYIFGGTTQRLLDEATVPIFMSH